MKNLKNELIFTFLLSIAILAAAFLVEWYVKLSPCNLCIYQRIIYFIAVLLIPAYLFLNIQKLLLAIRFNFFVGLLISLYHTLLQYNMLPRFLENIGCSIDLRSISNINDLPNMPSTACNIIDFEIFGLSLAFWNCIIMLFIIGILSGYIKTRRI